MTLYGRNTHLGLFGRVYLQRYCCTTLNGSRKQRLEREHSSISAETAQSEPTELAFVRPSPSNSTPQSCHGLIDDWLQISRQQLPKEYQKSGMLRYMHIATPLNILLWESRKLALRLAIPPAKVKNHDIHAQRLYIDGVKFSNINIASVNPSLSHVYDFTNLTCVSPESQCNSAKDLKGMSGTNMLPSKEVNYSIDTCTVSTISDVNVHVAAQLQRQCDNITYVQSYTHSADTEMVHHHNHDNHDTTLFRASEGGVALDGRYLDDVFQIRSDTSEIMEVAGNVFSKLKHTTDLENEHQDNKSVGVFYDDDDAINRHNFEVNFPLEKLHPAVVLHTGLPGTMASAKLNSSIHYVPSDRFTVSSVLVHTNMDSSRKHLSMTSRSQNKQPDNSTSRPNIDQLRQVQDNLSEGIQHVFVKRHNYRMYRQDVVFENNFFLKSYKTRGILRYAVEIAKFRVYVHFKYANVRMEVLKATVSEEEGSVMVRWRAKGIPQARAFMFWKFLPWKYAKSQNVEAEWIDGFSTFLVDSDSFIYKHKLDRVIPEEEKEVLEEGGVEKLAGLI